MIERNRRGEAVSFAERTAAVTGIVVALFLLGVPTPASAQFAVIGGYNGILGVYLSAGRILSIAPGTDLALGVAYAQTTGTDPLMVLTISRPLPGGWTASFETSYAGLGGDYRVDRLPEAMLTKSRQMGDSFLRYGLEFGAGYYQVRPAGIRGARAHADARLATVSIPLGNVISTTAEVGYRQYVYSTGAHGAGWGTVQLAAAPSPDSLLTLAYLRQVPSGTSPLLFDAISEDHTLTGSIAVRPVQGLVLTHSQSYSFLSSSITARVYRLSIEVPGHAFIASWDQVAQTAYLLYRWSGGP